MFINSKDKIQKPAKNTLVAIRIIELWLNFLADKKMGSEIILSVQSGEKLEVTIQNNDPLPDFEELKKYTLQSSIYERATANEGIIDISLSPDGNTLFKASFLN